MMSGLDIGELGVNVSDWLFFPSLFESKTLRQGKAETDQVPVLAVIKGS